MFNSCSAIILTLYRKNIILVVLMVVVNAIEAYQNVASSGKRYKPDWKDLDTRPLPQWYDEAKIGIMLHWGVYSVPSFRSEWFWYNYRERRLNAEREFMTKYYTPGFSYQDFAPMFMAEFFEPEVWANLFRNSGAKYVILTSKHRDGYTLFPSNKSYAWNSLQNGPIRDLVDDLSNAVRKEGLKFGVFYSLMEWFNPVYLKDKSRGFSTRDYVTAKVWPELQQLVYDYKPSVIWADGDDEAKDTYWNSTGFLSWLYNDSPVKDEVVVNDQWGKYTFKTHGDFYHYNKFGGVLQSHKWENVFSLDSKSWGYRRNMYANEILSAKHLVHELVATVSCGGNVLINIGPTKDGTIAPIFQERLLSLGTWLSINGEAIYKSSPWLFQHDSHNQNVWYTLTRRQYNSRQPTAKPSRNDTVTAIYAITLQWPEGNVLKVQDISSYVRSGVYQLQLLGNEDVNLTWSYKNKLSEIVFPDIRHVKSEHAWTLKITKK